MPDIRPPMVKSENDRFWTKYCGFFDLSVEQFMTIQEALLNQQIPQLAGCPIGQKMLGSSVPANLDELRKSVPLTTYENYLPELQTGSEEYLPEKPHVWAHTSGDSSSFLRVPYSLQFYHRLLDNLMATFILACSRKRGQSSITEGDRVLYNVAPSPYLSGILAAGASENFRLKPVLAPDTHDNLDFKEKMSKGFELSLRDGVDILIAMSSVLVKMGNDFNNHPREGKASRLISHPGILYRFARSWLKARMEKRSILPRDLWPVKAIIGWGIDTDVYRDLIYQYWGVYPYEFHACTEAGIIAMQSWTRKDMTLVPNCNFFEFIPESEWLESKRKISYQPRTVLLSEVKPGQRYELVITGFHGMPFVRYRLGHLIKITSLSDEEAQVYLPQMVFEVRADDLIDIAGFTRISEKTLVRALANTGLSGRDWLVRKEFKEDKPALHLYIELDSERAPPELASTIHDQLKKIDPFYHDLETMMDIKPLEVTLLKPGTFASYYRVKTESGVELSKRKPPRMNTPDDAIEEIIHLSTRQSESQTGSSPTGLPNPIPIRRNQL